MKIRVNVIRLITYLAIGFGTIWLFVVYRQRKTTYSIDRKGIISKISKIKEDFSGQVPVELLRKLDDLQSSLESNFRISSALESSCGNGLGLVKDEIYKGNIDTQKYWYEGAWILNETSPVSQPLEDLVTILLVHRAKSPETFISRLTKDLKGQYHRVRVIVGIKTSEENEKANFKFPNNKIELFVSSTMSESEMWMKLVGMASTEYVLVGRDIEVLHTKWINLERSLRLLNGFGDKISAVGGATRNLTGHWKTNCYQADIMYYNLVLEQGYETSTCDCMQCTALWYAGPFVARTAELDFESKLSSELMFLDWFLQRQLQASASALSCPDILYIVDESSKPEITRDDWKDFSNLRKVKSVAVLDSPPLKQHTFTCDEVGMICEPNTQADSHLLPWCCIQNYNYIISVIDELANRFGFHYELDSGSLLGAVKINNFIPWDIDGDLYIPTEQIHLFDDGAQGALAFAEAGIKVFGHLNDNYWDIGAKYFQISYGGISFEMMGKRGNLTLDKLPDSGNPPTRIQVGNVWARVHSHPGEYLRGRYGPGYLRHAQAWRFMDSMNSAFDYGKQNSGTGWKPCSTPGDHSCLDRYPSDGNINLLPHRFN